MKIKGKNIIIFEDLFEFLPEHLLKQVMELKESQQSPLWHPEGSVYVHTKIVVERLLPTDDLNLVIAGVFHDLGKFSTAKINKKGNICNHGHEAVSANFVKRDKEFIESLGGDYDEILGIVENHDRYKVMSNMRKSKQEKMRALPYFKKLVLFGPADTMTDHGEKLITE
jgi:poly(A) polymerase